MRGHVSARFFHCDDLFLQGKHSGFRRIVASVYSDFFECVANFEAFTCIIKICYLLKICFTHLQQYDDNHCVYLARIQHHSEKSRRKHDHVCAT